MVHDFRAKNLALTCEGNNTRLITTTPYWPQQNGEVERQNRSILKKLIISQTAGGDWMADLNKYLLMYRSSPHSTTRRTPAEMLFGRNIRDRIPGIHQPMEVDEETADRDKREKEKGKVYADKRRGAKPNQIEEGDSVLVKRPTRQNKLVSNFDPEVFKVVKRSGGDTIVESEDSGRKYRRHVSHLQQVPKATDDCNTHPPVKDDNNSATMSSRASSMIKTNLSEIPADGQLRSTKATERRTSERLRRRSDD